MQQGGDIWRKILWRTTWPNVKKYDDSADEAVVDKIVKHLGIALRSKDSSSVAASDKSELDRIRDGFCTKKLELDKEKAEAVIKTVAEQMKGDKLKCRVVFYYLLAKETGNLGKFA